MKQYQSRVTLWGEITPPFGGSPESKIWLQSTASYGIIGSNWFAVKPAVFNGGQGHTVVMLHSVFHILATISHYRINVNYLLDKTFYTTTIVVSLAVRLL